MEEVRCFLRSFFPPLLFFCVVRPSHERKNDNMWAEKRRRRGEREQNHGAPPMSSLHPRCVLPRGKRKIGFIPKAFSAAPPPPPPKQSLSVWADRAAAAAHEHHHISPPSWLWLWKNREEEDPFVKSRPFFRDSSHDPPITIRIFSCLCIVGEFLFPHR